MKLLIRCLLVLLLFSLAACGPPLSAVYVSTQPPGGMVQVKETGTIVPDGGKIHLRQGTYHLSPYQVPNSPGDVQLMVNGFDEDRVVVPTGPEEMLSRFTVHTVPAGGTVTVVENNRTVADGGSVTLPGGHFTLRPSLAGYRPQDVILDVKQNTEEEILIPLGTGYAQLVLTSDPPGALVAIDGEDKGPAPVTVQLPEGIHQLGISLAGYYPQQQSVSVQPAHNQNLKLALKPVPTMGQVQVQTDPPGGEIVFKGRKAGKGTANLGRLPFGRYQVEGRKTLDKFTRLVGKTSFSLNRDKSYRVKLKLRERQRRFAGDWYPQNRALQLEEQRYQGQRVANPVSVSVDAARLKVIGSPESLVQSLHAIMRVGDRVKVQQAGKHWILWKRNATTEPEFVTMADALFSDSSYNLPWAADQTSASVMAASGDNAAAELAFALHRARAALPIIDLNREQLAASGETIFRSRADGDLSLVVEADEAPQLAAKVVEVAPKVWMAQIPAGDVPLELSWKKRPRRVLVVSDAAAPFAAKVAEDSLLINEKKIISVAGRTRVDRLVRLSGGPDYAQWQRQEFTANGPLAAQLDLSRDEIGPNGHFGDYQRIWLVNYRNGGAQSQRQVTAFYHVVDKKKDFSSEKFLRRGKLGSQ